MIASDKGLSHGRSCSQQTKITSQQQIISFIRTMFSDPSLFILLWGKFEGIFCSEFVLEF